jgi:hypothetical protein
LVVVFVTTCWITLAVSGLRPGGPVLSRSRPDTPASANAATCCRWRASAEGRLRLGAAGLRVLTPACAGHEGGDVSPDPMIGCCWDADRLELARLGRRPIARLLSTAAAHDPAVLVGAWQPSETWALAANLAEAWSLDTSGVG